LDKLNGLPSPKLQLYESIPSGPLNWIGVPLHTGELELQLQSGIGLISTVPEQDFDPQLLATVRLTV
jgi:hypothetical protein